MNFRKLGKILGKIMILEGILMIAPLLVALIYQEKDLLLMKAVLMQLKKSHSLLQRAEKAY